MGTNYNIKKQLGEGGFGKVYLIEMNNKNYALKKIFIREMNKEEIKKQHEEINIIKNLNNQYIVKYYDSFYEKDHLCILMEYAGDSNLKSFIQRYKDSNQLIEEQIIKNIIIQITLGLKEIHKSNIIHRDLTPDNVFIDDYNEIKIGDFGVSKKLEGTKYAKTIIGKYEYFAPELIKREKYYYRVDIYALGCIIYELFTLNSYFHDKNIEDKEGKIDTDIYNKKWQDLIEKLLQKDYHQRPCTEEIYNYVININNNGTKIDELTSFLINFEHIDPHNSLLSEEYFYLKKEQSKLINNIFNQGLISDIIPIKLNYIDDKRIAAYRLICNNFSAGYNDWIPAWHGTLFKNLESIIKYGLRLPETKLKNGKLTPKPTCSPDNVCGIKNWDKAIFATPCLDCASIYALENKSIVSYHYSYPYSPSLVELRIRPKSYSTYKAKECVGKITCYFPTEHNDNIYRITSEKDVIIKSIVFLNPIVLTDKNERKVNLVKNFYQN